MTLAVHVKEILLECQGHTVDIEVLTVLTYWYIALMSGGTEKNEYRFFSINTYITNGTVHLVYRCRALLVGLGGEISSFNASPAPN